MSPPCPSQAQAMGPEETWALISHLTTTLVRELEPERLSEVQRGLAQVASRVTATTDLEMVIPELIQLLGGDGKALRALKMVSDRQCVVGIPFSHNDIFSRLRLCCGSDLYVGQGRIDICQIASDGRSFFEINDRSWCEGCVVCLTYCLLYLCM